MRRTLFLALLLAAFAPQAEAQIDADGMKMFGGAWLSDCAKPKGAKVTVSENALVFLDGDRRVATTNATLTGSYYGNSPPESYMMTVFGDMPDGDQMLLTIWEDKTGRYATLEGGGSVQKALGKPALGLRFHQCAAAPATPATPAAPATSATSAKSATPPADAAAFPGPAQLAADPAFAAPYKKALGKLAKEQDWLLALEGPAPDTKSVTVEGKEYLVLQSCKIHDCAESNTTLFWDAQKKLVYGKVRAGGKSTMIGSPPPAVAKEIGNSWWKQWGVKP